MSRRTRRHGLIIAALTAGSLWAAAPAHAVSAYTIRPAEADPLVWMGVNPAGNGLTLQTPVSGANETQAWIFRKIAGTATQPLYALASYRPPDGLTSTRCVIATAALGRCNATATQWPSNAIWEVRDAGTDQLRSVGLVAYGRNGSRLRIRSRTGRCLGYYRPSFNGQIVRGLQCVRGAISQQFTLQRVTLP
jgi:hypothetical protein